MCKEVTVGYFELISRYLPLRTEENQAASQMNRVGATVRKWDDQPAMKKEC
jgi:hypothetical protein